MRTYKVIATLKFPPAGSPMPAVFFIRAATNAGAIKDARRRLRNYVGHDRHDGPVSYRAKLA